MIPEISGSPSRRGSFLSRLGWAGGLTRQGSRAPFWALLLPFFISAVLFWSAFFALFSPLPLLLLGFSAPRKARLFVWAASLSNSALVFALGGSPALATYLIFAVVPSLALLEAVTRKRRLETATALALLAVAVATGMAVFVFSHYFHVHPWAEIRNAFSDFVDYWMKSAPLSGQDPAEIEAWKQGILIELPSALAVLALVTVWLNFVLLLRLNPRNIRASLGLTPDFFQRWKSPEFLVWPTILAGATLVFDFGVASDLGRNVFKFLMAIYALQGISILSFLFTRWKLKGPLRMLGYGVSVLIAMPLLLSLGFFDVWFDFRAKIRQS